MKAIPTVHAIRSLPLPPDEIAVAEPAPLPRQPETPVSRAINTPAPVRAISFSESTSPEPTPPSFSPMLKRVADVNPVPSPAEPVDVAVAAEPDSSSVSAASRRLLTTPHVAAPAPATKPAPYILPNHVLPLALELQIANSLNAGGKGPLTADASHNFHLAAAVTGVITTNLNTASPQQSTNKSVGGLVSFGKRSSNWLDFNINYQFSRFTESYAAITTVPVNFQEISAEYLHTWRDDGLSIHRVRPFLGLGGGALLFTPTKSQFATQTRPSGVVDLGVDIPLHGERISLRLNSHTLVYKAPDFNSSALTSNHWVATTEPTAGLNFRF